MINKLKKLFDKIKKDESDLCVNLDIGKEIPCEIHEAADRFSNGYWNYRLIEKEDKWTGGDNKEYYSKYFVIHEVYYDGNNEVFAWTEEPIKLYFQVGDDIKILNKRLKKASKLPILKVIKEKDEDNEEIEKLVSTNKYLKDYKYEDLSNF